MCLNAASLGKNISYLCLSNIPHLAHIFIQYFYIKKKKKICNQIHLLVPVGESHHDVQRGQTEVEVETGVAVSDFLLLIVHGPAYAVLSHHTLSNCPSTLLGLHQLVYLGITGRTDTREGTERASVQKYKSNKTGHRIALVMDLARPNLPGIESAEEEDDQTNNALSVPPLHRS